MGTVCDQYDAVRRHSRRCLSSPFPQTRYSIRLTNKEQRRPKTFCYIQCHALEKGRENGRYRERYIAWDMYVECTHSFGCASTLISSSTVSRIVPRASCQLCLSIISAKRDTTRHGKLFFRAHLHGIFWPDGCHTRVISRTIECDKRDRTWSL